MSNHCMCFVVFYIDSKDSPADTKFTQMLQLQRVKSHGRLVSPQDQSYMLHM